MNQSHLNIFCFSCLKKTCRSKSKLDILLEGILNLNFDNGLDNTE